jgi:hypothetical protein
MKHIPKAKYNDKGEVCRECADCGSLISDEELHQPLPDEILEQFRKQGFAIINGERWEVIDARFS